MFLSMQVCDHDYEAPQWLHQLAICHSLELEHCRHWTTHGPCWYMILSDLINIMIQPWSLLITESQTGALAKAIKSHPDLHFGVYFSQYEWYHPLYLQDKSNGYKTQYYVKVTLSISWSFACILLGIPAGLAGSIMKTTTSGISASVPGKDQVGGQ